MIEFLVVGLAFAVVVLLALRQSTMGRQMSQMETNLAQLQVANTAGFEDGVSQMIDELKAVADSACDEVAAKIDVLRRLHSESGSVLSEPACGRGESNLLPIGHIIQLAIEGVSTIDIARQTGIGVAEVELTLRFHRDRTPSQLPLRHTMRRANGASAEHAEPSVSWVEQVHNLPLRIPDGTLDRASKADVTTHYAGQGAIKEVAVA